MTVNIISFFNRNALPCLFILFLIQVAIFWPGILTPDSRSQYEVALTGGYDDHHPPMMSFLWHMLLYIYPGSGLMLLFHMILLYGSIYYLLQCFPQDKKIIAFIFPFIPSVFVYSGFIWKDVGFAFSFLLVGSALAALNVNNKSLSLRKGFILGCILFYGNAVKFQAQYCTPLILLWMAYTSLKKEECSSFRWQRYGKKFLMIGAIFYSCVNLFNFSLKSIIITKNHWQYVKAFDLAAISLEKNKSFFPDFIKTPNFSMDRLREIFNYQKVDEIICSKKGVLKSINDEEELRQLKEVWLKTVLHHPFYYLKHRCRVLAYGLLGCHGFTPWGEDIRKTQSSSFIVKTVIFLYQICRFTILSHFLQILFSFLYLCLGLRTIRLTKAAVPLVFFNGTGILLVSILFFFSMAGTPRYTYAAICFFHTSHIFAYHCYCAWRNKRKGALSPPKKEILN